MRIFFFCLFYSRECRYFFVGNLSFCGTFLLRTITYSDCNIVDGTTHQWWYNTSVAKTSTLLVMTFNRLRTLRNHWSYKSSFFFIAHFKVADPSSRSTLLNVSQCLDLVFSSVFLPQAKHFSFFIISLNLRRILISKGSSCCCSTVISVELSSFSFVALIICLILCHLWNHRNTGGDIWVIQEWTK